MQQLFIEVSLKEHIILNEQIRSLVGRGALNKISRVGDTIF